jgi:hypothetical protein
MTLTMTAPTAVQTKLKDIYIYIYIILQFFKLGFIYLKHM